MRTIYLTLTVVSICIFSSTLFSQAIKKKVNPVRTGTSVTPKNSQAIKLSDLGITVWIDTAIFNIEDTSVYKVSFSPKNEHQFDFDIAAGNNYMTEKKANYGREEYVMSIGSLYKLEQYSDSSTIVINGNKFWFVRSTLRDVPLYWADMHEKKKLSSDQLSTFLKSDKASWEDCVFSAYMYVQHPVTKEMIQISVGYGYEGKDNKAVDEMMKNIAKGIRFK